ncbi:Imm52 family immunity protein [Stenotrophomonas sp. TWI143]|uniref:Imm52 family immunity protein n=1 Tax=Stenotrophomonas sp. TWI143 TaxID=3136771 RepID=UPI002988E88C|nr:immunity 52 family protein [Stenotrophomonas maltophilia]HDS1232819.1 immunity 52 family protein [Stenotrophomonas maltophilia]
MTEIYNAFIDTTVPVEVLSAEAAYRQLLQLTEELGEIHHLFQNWALRDSSGRPVPLSDKTRFIDAVAENAAYYHRKYPTAANSGGAGASITPALSQKAHDQPGCPTLDYRPWFGRVTLSINAPVQAFGPDGTSGIIRSCVRSIATRLDAVFVATDVTSPLPDGEGYETYAHFHQLFPHRRWLGWMGFVPHLVPKKFIPEAASMEVVKGKGTMIVALDEPFDLRNPEHLRRAHQVELRMANAGLLDITDPTLLE